MKEIKFLEEYTGKDFPKVFTKKVSGITNVYVPYVISEDENGYKYTYLMVGPGKFNYEDLVDKIIGLKYSAADMFAVINNYLLDPNNDKYLTEYLEMQDHRKHAKEYAKRFFN